MTSKVSNLDPEKVGKREMRVRVRSLIQDTCGELMAYELLHKCLHV